MASLRISLINEAKQLAAAADLVGSGHGYHVPAATIERIHRRLRCVDEPIKVLEWAWRWQRARHDESGWRVDGLAALYLLAALIDLQSTAAHDTDWPYGGTDPSNREPAHDRATASTLTRAGHID